MDEYGNLLLSSHAKIRKAASTHRFFHSPTCACLLQERILAPLLLCTRYQTAGSSELSWWCFQEPGPENIKTMKDFHFLVSANRTVLRMVEGLLLCVICVFSTF